MMTPPPEKKEKTAYATDPIDFVCILSLKTPAIINNLL